MVQFLTFVLDCILLALHVIFLPLAVLLNSVQHRAKLFDLLFQLGIELLCIEQLDLQLVEKVLRDDRLRRLDQIIPKVRLFGAQA